MKKVAINCITAISIPSFTLASLKAPSPIVRSALPGSKVTEVRDLHKWKAPDSGEREVWAR
jgi:hypothetical protein